MKFWTVQQQSTVDTVLAEGIYQPDFSMSTFVARTPKLAGLYELVLESFNELNGTSLPGLVFSFVGFDGESLFEIPHYASLKEVIVSSKPALQTLWSKLAQGNPVVLELEYANTFNPVFLGINDFQALMPPVTPMPPFYTEQAFLDIISSIRNGIPIVPRMPVAAIQAHLPYIAYDNLVASYDVFELE